MGLYIEEENKMHERKKLKEAKYFYSKMIEEQEHKEIFKNNLTAFLSSARSVLLYALSEVETKPRERQWYNNCISSSPILQFFKNERDTNIHEEPIGLRLFAYFKKIIEGILRLSGSLSLIAYDKEGDIKQQYSSGKTDPTQKKPKIPLVKETNYKFNNWGGGEDVLTLCQIYIQELDNVIKDGVKKGFSTG